MNAPQSGWHRGKGSRRWPIYTSAGHKRQPQWAKGAMHLVDERTLKPPLAEVEVGTPAGKCVSEAIYLFDQEAARERFRYGVKFIAGAQRWGYRLLIVIEEPKREATARAAARLTVPKPRRLWRPGCEFWSDLLTPAHKGHAGWYVALYHEYASQRSDGKDYVAFLFRDEKRTRFGMQEFLVDEATAPKSWKKWREMALRVNRDARFRQELLSDDPDLPKLWRRH